MKPFRQFVTEGPEVLEESLDSAVEFYITDDSRLPKSFFGAFSLDDQEYGMSLELSQFKKIYILKVYKIMNKKKSMWRYASPKHIPIVLSTTIKFVEAAMAFLGPNFDAVLVPYSKKYNARRFKKLTQRMVTKSYVKSFRYVPVEGSGKHHQYDYAFILKKIKQPQMVFKSKTLQGYTWDGGELPLGVATGLEVNVMTKPVVSLKPSKRYHLGDLGELEVNTPDDEVVVKAASVKPVLDNKTTPVEEPKKEPEDIKDTEEWTNLNMTPVKFTMVMHPQLKSMRSKLEQFGYDENKVKDSDLSYVLNQTAKDSPSWKALMMQYKMMDDSGNWDLKAVKSHMKFYSDWVKNKPAIEVKNKAEEIAKNINKLEFKSDKIINAALNPTPKNNSADVISLKGTLAPTDLEIGEEFSAQSVPRYNAEYKRFEAYLPKSSLNSEDYASQTVAGEIAEKFTKTYYDKVKSHKHYVNISEYTGSTYTSYNEGLRSAATALRKGTYDPAYYAQIFQDDEKTNKLYSVFADLPPLEQPMWVFRNCEIIAEYKEVKPGDDFVDPAFLSTTVRTEMSFGGPEKLAIWLPKGTPIIPVFNTSSSSPEEREIILPPMSILKVLQVDKVQQYGTMRYGITCMYTGTAYPDLVSKTKMKAGATMSEALNRVRKATIMTEKKKDDGNIKGTPKYDRWNSTFGETGDREMVKQLKAIMKKGSVKKSK